MHELDSVRLSLGLPPAFGTLLCSCPLTGSRTLNLQCFQTRSPGNRPWARDLSEYEFLRKYSQKKLITKQESRIWKGKKKKKKQKKASKSLGSDKVLVSAWFCRSSEAINYTWCLFHPVPGELGFFYSCISYWISYIGYKAGMEWAVDHKLPGTSSRVVLLTWRWSPVKDHRCKLLARAAEVKRWICRANETWGGFWTRDQLCFLMFTFQCFTIKLKVFLKIKWLAIIYMEKFRAWCDKL